MMIKKKIIGKGATGQEKSELNRLYRAYRKEAGIDGYDRFYERFWEGVENGGNFAVMAIDRKTDRPLGFIKMSVDMKKGKPDIGFIDYYTVPEARGMNIATKLAKFGTMQALRMGAKKVESSAPINSAGKAIVRKVERKQKAWKRVYSIKTFGGRLNRLKAIGNNRRRRAL